MHEELRLNLIEAYVAREISLAEVAKSMEHSRRQCPRLIKRYRELGAAGLVSRCRRKPGYHQLNTSNLANTDPTECGLHVSKETGRKLMIAEKTGNHALLPTPDSACRRHYPDSLQKSGQICFQHDISTLTRQNVVVAKLRCPSGDADGGRGCFLRLLCCTPQMLSVFHRTHYT
ncbi:helix-turn-helix domain-containing protein [Salmonella enterica subsp. enterica serovar Lexington]|nr:helix-turn-helix domain-containing protein [Salmonella enterica subsp. enterica serovar Lexington]EAA5923618.1 helix-turn-helix domain-containing protein [Salmonella enterica]EAA7937540.1 helix-turn-helix domain-containing protein [Salmonella enterica subsp. enterica serovar Teko]MIG58733.1 helix-turn-helix domain-containing protein [Salmonella enterica subsp. houtenae]EAA7876499.1 helix-turn-helix domain-containing protein [Salmonella enterica subsp. enterica serovar Lexington]